MADGKIAYPERFKEAQTSASDGAFVWGFLRGAFGPSIMPTDIDALVERRGRYLAFETKAPGVPIPEGQWRLLDDWNRYRGVTVFIIWGKTAPEICEMAVWHPYFKGGAVAREPFPADAQVVFEKCSVWFKYANSKPFKGR